MSGPEDDALALVVALFGGRPSAQTDIDMFEERWEAIDEQLRVVYTLTMLLGTMIEHEAARRNQSVLRVVNQIRSDIAGDRYAHELGIEPRD